MKIIGYARVSTGEQVNSGTSLSAQVEKIRAYAALYDLELVEIIEDPGQSAKSLQRPGIQRALQMMRDGQAEGIIVAKLDRLTRSMVDQNMLLSNYFTEKAKYQAFLFSVGEQVDTRTAGGRMMLHMHTAVSQWEREVVSERTKAALAYKKSQGVKLGPPTMGETQEELVTLKYIGTLRGQGLALRAIAHRLNTEGAKTKRGGRWGSQTVANYLKLIIGAESGRLRPLKIY